MFGHLFDALIGLSLSWWGIGVLGILDATIVFNLPFGIDAAVVIVTARHRDLFWLFPIAGAAGSVIGAATSYWIGQVAGDHGLARYVPKRRLARVMKRVKRSGAITLAALDLIPPPFPFTPFVLAAGALHVSRTRFFTTLAVVRLLRFGLEAWLALRYGHAVIAFLQSAVVRDIVGVCILLAIAFSVFTVVRLFWPSGQESHRSHAKSHQRAHRRA